MDQNCLFFFRYCTTDLQVPWDTISFVATCEVRTLWRNVSGIRFTQLWIFQINAQVSILLWDVWAWPKFPNCFFKLIRQTWFFFLNPKYRRVLLWIYDPLLFVKLSLLLQFDKSLTDTHHKMPGTSAHLTAFLDILFSLPSMITVIFFSSILNHHLIMQHHRNSQQKNVSHSWSLKTSLPSQFRDNCVVTSFDLGLP